MENSLFVVEGMDYAGKSSCTKRFTAEYPDYNILLTGQPGYSQLGANIRNILLYQHKITPLAQMLLFQADRAEHIETVIKPAIANKRIIISDRWCWSTIAYQSQNCDLTQILMLNSMVQQGVYPRTIFYFQIDFDEFLRRRSLDNKKDSIESIESVSYWKSVWESYELLSKSNSCYIINANKSVNEVYEQFRSGLIELMYAYNLIGDTIVSI